MNIVAWNTLPGMQAAFAPCLSLAMNPQTTCNPTGLARIGTSYYTIKLDYYEFLVRGMMQHVRFTPIVAWNTNGQKQQRTSRLVMMSQDKCKRQTNKWGSPLELSTTSLPASKKRQQEEEQAHENELR
ncbi:hypothetical protein DUNSADRAFT_10775 [Dunaliella salina]|uniref:Encoded protein n=1 Tax=Dunaliella salina TaxID=3046 RepID=A0ABQ7GEM8_DUNSA|nr:hypothetical protein DUNSADRAFT_10775 [Dunaliella salina]|eukprot:KAF5833029.1 hypothetical protein DUNSADRAFT_10775 [Dunaliella salina]